MTIDATPAEAALPRIVTLTFQQGRPRVPILIEAPGGSTHFGWATIDSGAHRSILPRDWAQPLGLAKALRRERIRTAGADDRRIKTWSQPEPVIVQVAYIESGVQRLWGPRMSLVPSFAKTSEAILGMADFFPYFTVTFEAGTYGAVRLEPRSA